MGLSHVSLNQDRDDSVDIDMLSTMITDIIVQAALHTVL
jgi:hypothetical protein